MSDDPAFYDFTRAMYARLRGVNLTQEGKAMLVFKEMTEGVPNDGSGQAVALAGTPVNRILRVYKNAPAGEWRADVKAQAYKITAGAGQQDQLQEVERMDVPLASIIFTPDAA